MAKTEKTTMSVYEELCEQLKFKPKKASEDEQAFLKKLAAKAEGISEPAWAKLSAKAQNWVNDAVGAVESKEEIPTPAGMDDDDDEEETETEVEEDEDDEEEEKVSSKRGRPAGKKTAVKVAKKGKKPEAVKAKGKAAKEKNGKTAKGKGNGRGSGGGGRKARLFSDDQRVTVLASENPKRENTESYDRFEHYVRGKKGMTVREALDAGVTSSDLKWDSDHDFIKIE